MIPIWQWSGYSTKEKAVYKTKQLVEEIDYKVHKDVKLQGSKTGQKINQYLFTKDGFKHFLLMSNTNRGQQIRNYFIDVEKRYGREIAQATPIDQVISKVLGAFDEINNQLQTQSFANTVNTQAITEHTQEIIDHEQRIQKLEKSNINKIRTTPKKLQIKTLGNERKVNYFKRLAKKEGSGQAAIRKMIREDGSERTLEQLQKLYA